MERRRLFWTAGGVSRARGGERAGVGSRGEPRCMLQSGRSKERGFLCQEWETASVLRGWAGGAAVLLVMRKASAQIFSRHE